MIHVRPRRACLGGAHDFALCPSLQRLLAPFACGWPASERGKKPLKTRPASCDAITPFPANRTHHARSGPAASERGKTRAGRASVVQNHPLRRGKLDGGVPLRAISAATALTLAPALARRNEHKQDESTARAPNSNGNARVMQDRRDRLPMLDLAHSPRYNASLPRNSALCGPLAT